MSMMAPEAPPQGGPPPELLQMLAGGAGAGQAGPPPEASAGGGSPVEALRGLIESVQQYLQVEPDEEDKAVAAQCLSAFQKLLAKNQQQQDAALGTTPAHKFMRKNSGGGY